MASTTILSDNGVSSGSAGLKSSGGNDGVLILQTTTSGGTATNAVYVDTSQNVGVGTTSPKSLLSVAGDVNGLNSSSFSIKHYQQASSTYTATQIQSVISGASAYLTFSTNGNWTNGNAAEAARIDSSGNLLVGRTSQNTSERLNVTYAPANQGIVVNTSTTFSGNSTLINFLANGTQGGVIAFTNSGVTTAYVTSSDYRLKENIKPMTGALAKVDQLKPCTYTWKSDGSSSQGFIAHELQAVVSEAVIGEKDAVNEDGSIKPQGIDTSFLVATLTAAIQEQQALITQLQADVAALKGAQQ